MPMLLEFIDAIARKKGRDVLYLTFATGEKRRNLKYVESLDSRRTIIAWLDANKVGWSMCGDFADEDTLRSYAGQIYLDVPYDVNNITYQAVQQFLEHEDGTMRFDDVKFLIVSLEKAMENAHHDEPGFWDRWGAEF